MDRKIGSKVVAQGFTGPKELLGPRIYRDRKGHRIVSAILRAILRDWTINGNLWQSLRRNDLHAVFTGDSLELRS